MNQLDFQRYASGCLSQHRATAGLAESPQSSRAAAKNMGGIDTLQKFLWGALIISFPFTAISLWPTRMKTFGQPTVLLAGLLGALVVAEAVTRRGGLFIPKGRSAMLLAAFLIILALSFFINYPINPYMWPGHSPWAKSAKQLSQWYADGLVVYLTLRFVQTWNDLRFAFRSYFVGLVLTAGAAVIEVAAIHWPAGTAQKLFEILHNGAWAHQASRLELLAYEPSMASDYLLCVLPLLICGSFYWKSRWWTVAWSAVGLLLFCGTFSFGSFAALFAAGLIVGVVYARRGSKSLLLGVFLLLAVLIGAAVSSSKGNEFLTDRIQQVLENGLGPSIPSYSTRQRLAGAEAAFNIFLEHPWTGVGVGKSPFYMYSAYPVWALQQSDVAGGTFDEGSDPSQSSFGSYDPGAAISFNLLIQTLAETGAIGGVIFVALLVSMLADCYQSLNEAKEKWKRRVFAGILLALVAQIVHYNAMSWTDMRYWFFIWGLAMCAPRLFMQKDPKMPERRVIFKRVAAVFPSPRRIKAVP